MTNPLNEFISDEIYDLIKPFLDETQIRNHIIRQKYRVLRKEGMKSFDAIDKLLIEYPYLQFDTIRKIVCTHPSKKVLEKALV